MQEDALKNLSQTVITEPLWSPSEPIIVDGNLILEEDAANAIVKARGHIIVNGAAEYCELESELGSVFLLYESMQYTKIRAAQNVYVRHSLNSTLTAGNDIVIEKSVLQSTLQAGRKVISEADSAKIVGGRTEARERIFVQGLGNENGVETEAAVSDDAGTIAFSELFPGVVLRIGTCRVVVKERYGAGLAYLRDGAIHIRTDQE